MKTWVKIVYGEKSNRKPVVISYGDKDKADAFIDACLKWGIDIVSCEKISEGQALREIKAEEVTQYS
jgi:hypothetical protein